MTGSVVIVGAGQAGGTLARALVDLEYRGPITLLGNENHPPYDRPPLSKEFLTKRKKAEDCYLWSSQANKKVLLRLGINVQSINRLDRSIRLSTGEYLRFDTLVLTTGSSVRRLNVPGANLSRVFYLRTIEDSIDIRLAVENNPSSLPWLIVGAGWIGLEIASSLRNLGVEVVVVEPQSRICARSIPHDFSSYLQEAHERRGVEFLMAQSVTRFDDALHHISVELSNGEIHRFAGAIVGIGVEPNVELAKASGLSVDDGIIVNEFGQTNDPVIYAAGDASRHPNKFLGTTVRLQSWSNAQNQAVAVANNIAGNPKPFEDIPWLWSDQFDLNIQLLGQFQRSTSHITRGDLAQDKFTRIYLSDDRACGVITVNNGSDIRVIKTAIERNVRVSPPSLTNPTISLKSILKEQMRI